VNLQRATAPDPYSLLPAVGSFTVTSSDVAEGKQLDRRFVHTAAGPDAGNESPGRLERRSGSRQAARW
jgi:hypothetical protein